MSQSKGRPFRLIDHPILWGLVYDLLYSSVLNFLKSLCRITELAEDLTQEAFIKLAEYDLSKKELIDFDKLVKLMDLNKADKALLEKQIWPLVASIAKNLFIDTTRQKRRTNASLDDQTLSFEPPVVSFDTAVDAAYDVNLGLEVLNEEEKKCISLYSEGYTQKEMSEKTGCSISAINSRVSRARNKMYELLIAC